MSDAYCHVKITSSAVNGRPSCHCTPGLSRHVTDGPSLATPPLSSVGASREPSAPDLVDELAKHGLVHDGLRCRRRWRSCPARRLLTRAYEAQSSKSQVTRRP